MRKRHLIGAVGAALAAGLVASAGALGKAPDLKLQVVQVGPKAGGGEPSLAIAPDGTMYASYPGNTKPDGQGMNLFVGDAAGMGWSRATSPETSSGDTSVNVDGSGAVYESNLNGIKANPNTLQVDVFKSLDRGQHWPVHGQSALESSNSSGQPFLVDRQWTDTAIPPGKTTNQAVVAMEYHDWVPGTVWVSTSTDGGKTFGVPNNVVTDPVAAQASVCDTIPGGMKIVPFAPGQKYPGRMYAAWLAADGANNLGTGCNETQMAAFHSVWIAYSDDGGMTWTDKLVFDGGPLHDGSEIFADLTLDNAGNPYIAFTMNLANQFDVWLTTATGYDAAADNAPLWRTPVKVDNDPGTHYFPAIAAGDPGHVFVGYIATPFVVPTAPWGKPMPSADKDADWYVWAAQSVNLNDAHPTFNNERITSVMHHGDVCTLGIFCSAVPNTNRNLLDFIDTQVDAKGRGHIVFTGDAGAYNGIYAANELGKPTLGRGGH